MIWTAIWLLRDLKGIQRMRPEMMITRMKLITEMKTPVPTDMPTVLISVRMIFSQYWYLVLWAEMISK